MSRPPLAGLFERLFDDGVPARHPLELHAYRRAAFAWSEVLPHPRRWMLRPRLPEEVARPDDRCVPITAAENYRCRERTDMICCVGLWRRYYWPAQ